MIVKIKSDNENLLSILNKNPNTDLGLYLRPLRNGHIIGNCVNENFYEVVFQDTKHSYTNYEDNQIDFKSYCSPEVILNVLRELFAHLIKDIEEVDKTNITWLNSTIGQLDTVPCEIEVENFMITSNWYKDGEFLLSRYLPNVEVIPTEGFKIYRLKIVSQSIVQAINTLGVVSFLTAVTNSRGFYLEDGQIEKYASILTNVKTVPYFVYYLYIKRCCIRSNKIFDKISPKLERKFLENNGNKAIFTINDTHKDRMIFVKSHLDMDKPVINFGCGEFKHEKYFGKNFKSKLISYDIDDYSELFSKVKERFDFDWEFTTDLSTIDTSLEYQLVLSEVIEHIGSPDKVIEDIFNLIDHFKINKIILTTPNKDFNKWYEMEEEEVRRDDHIFEFTSDEFKEFCSKLGSNLNYYCIGDSVNKDCVTLGCVINYEK